LSQTVVVIYQIEAWPMKDEDILEIVEAARSTGKIRKGINEATKAIERGSAKAVIVAGDVDPPEIIMHMPVLCDEKKIPLYKVSSKSELGRAAGILVGTSAIAIIDAGEAKKKLESIKKE
jgi:large subunit ribosomal protein L7Ae